MSSKTAGAPLRVVQALAGAEFGGAENFYTRLVCAMADEPGVEQTAFTRDNPARVAQLRDAGVPVQTFRFGGPLDKFDHLAYRRALRRYAPEVVLTYMNRASGSEKIATECHSVRSRRSPVLRSFHVSDVAMRRLHTLPPFWKVRTSGSRPRLPIRITLFTEPAMKPSFRIPRCRLSGYTTPKA